MELLQLTPAQLRRAADLKEQIDELERELSALGGPSATVSGPVTVHWTQTPAGRARLAKSARNSWRTRRRGSPPASPAASDDGKRLHWTQTPEGRAKFARIRQRRWQKR
jgi:hypothetical protein